MSQQAVTEDEASNADVLAWARSGAMALSGPADRPPLGPPRPLVQRLSCIADALHDHSARLGQPVRVSPLRILGERAAIGGLVRRGSTSCGGASHLLRGRDGWLAVSLARQDDIDLLPAWLGIDGQAIVEPLDSVRAAVAARSVAALVRSGAELGLPVAELSARPAPASGGSSNRHTALPHLATRLGDATATSSLHDLIVVDLSALWAGPLCASLLLEAGAEVWKVESWQRPDGARHGPAPFFDLLNTGKRSVALDFTSPTGRRELESIVARADVVIESSRPRALEQMGLRAAAMAASARPRVWASITGHGRGPEDRGRVGFGDDAAVAGGLVCWDGSDPCFCADAVADPASGLVAAAAALEALAGGGRWLLDISLAGVAAHLAGPTLPVAEGIHASPPAARTAVGSAAVLGADTDEILARVEDLGR